MTSKLSKNINIENINKSKEKINNKFYQNLIKKNKEYSIKIKNLELKIEKLKKQSFYYDNKKKAKLEKQNQKLLNLNVKLKSQNFMIKIDNNNIKKSNDNKNNLLKEITHYEKLKNNVKNNYLEILNFYDNDTIDINYKKNIFNEINNLNNYIES